MLNLIVELLLHLGKLLRGQACQVDCTRDQNNVGSGNETSILTLLTLLAGSHGGC